MPDWLYNAYVISKRAKKKIELQALTDPEPDSNAFKFYFIYTQGSQSTLIAPHVELPQSWMNFSMEKTPVRSSTDLPYSAWRPLSWLISAWVAGEPSDVGNADDVAVQVSLENTGAAGWAAIGISHSLGVGLSMLFNARPYPLVLTSVVFCRCSAWVYISVSTAPIL